MFQDVITQEQKSRLPKKRLMKHTWQRIQKGTCEDFQRDYRLVKKKSRKQFILNTRSSNHRYMFSSCFIRFYFVLLWKVELQRGGTQAEILQYCFPNGRTSWNWAAFRSQKAQTSSRSLLFMHKIPGIRSQETGPRHVFCMLHLSGDMQKITIALCFVILSSSMGNLYYMYGN